MPEIAARFENFSLIRADITDNNADHKALLNAFGLFGPPSILFFDRSGDEMQPHRLQGEADAAELEAHLDGVLAAI